MSLLLAETAQGYTNLCRLLTENPPGRRAPRSATAAPSLEARHDGLIILSGSRRDGLLPRTLEAQGLNAARRLAEHCKAVFGRERFFVEIQRNRVRGDLAASRALLEIDGSGKEIAELERRMRVNDQVVRYLTVRVDEDRQRLKSSRRSVRRRQRSVDLHAAVPRHQPQRVEKAL